MWMDTKLDLQRGLEVTVPILSLILHSGKLRPRGMSHHLTAFWEGGRYSEL